MPYIDEPTMSIISDHRFIRGVQLFNTGEYLEASDCFEDLFFEAVRDEPDFIRVFLQFSVGIHHVERGQGRPAIERINEGILLIESITNDRGIDLEMLGVQMESTIAQIEARVPGILWPRIRGK